MGQAVPMHTRINNGIILEAKAIPGQHRKTKIPMRHKPAKNANLINQHPGKHPKPVKHLKLQPIPGFLQQVTAP